MRRIHVAILACCLASNAIAGTPADPVMRPPEERLPPALLRAKAELRGIVARRDMAALLARVRAETKLDFGGSAGPEGFEAVWNSDAASRQRLWSTLDGILALPGVARGSDHASEYCAPYVYCMDLPDEIDPFEALVVIGTDVAIRDRPSSSGAVLRRVDHLVLTRVGDDPASEASVDWARIRLADGTAGYISTRWVRSPIDFRLTLRADDGSDTWWLGYLIAGD
ncbi:MAG TPA: SH3 domain-containing protein [Thermomonas sp.]|nr:SH3 domain-containing protein [Thermomonas sp.]